MEKKAYSGIERRKYSRYNLIYLTKYRVKLIINSSVYEVLDISQGGLKFLVDKGIELEKQIKGVIEFSEDESRAVEGKIVWQKDGKVGMKFNNLLPLFQLSYFQH